MNAQTEATTNHRLSMDRMYRVQRHFYDATRHYYLLGRDRMIAQLNVPRGGSVLEVGCGTARNLIAVAKQYPDATFYGLDISQEMLKTASENLRAAKTQSVTLACADATNFNAHAIFGRDQFDRIYFSYTLSMVPDWQMALNQAIKLLKSNGELHIVDFGQCDNLPNIFKTALFKWLKAFHVTPRAELNAELQKIAASHNAKLQWLPHCKGYAWIAVLRPN